MIVDSRKIPTGTNIQADLCIIGAGAAGITIAREFLNHPSRVVLLESGGLGFREQTQSLYQGSVAGHPYPPLHTCRRRTLGGTTSIWGGWCRPLDEIDFSKRDWVPFSGWPFTKDHLKAEYARARAICKLGQDGSDGEVPGSGSDGHLPSQVGRSFEDILFEVAPTRFGETYRADIDSAPNLDLMLYSNALEIQTDGNQRQARLVRVATLAGNHYLVSAREFVLAAGGIENPRILLASRGSRSTGVGNDHDLVGRFFADHLHFGLPAILLDNRPVPEFYHLRKTGAAASRGGIALTDNVRRHQQLLGFAVTMHNGDDPHDLVYPTDKNAGYSSLQALVKPLMSGNLPDRPGYHFRTILRDLGNAASLSFRRLIKPRWRTLMLGCRAEQAPNPESRVSLDHERDILGMNKVSLDWRLTEQDLDSLRKAQQILNNALDLPAGHLEESISALTANVTGASHHIGTTRMHRDPKFGVVDEMCRVHGVSNLYIAGSSVFPTSGFAPPTLTIVALAIRLADCLKRSMG
jgi:choline dehydrogenase-like flavoprotein